MMDENIAQSSELPASPCDQKWGCGFAALLAVTIIWILTASGLAQSTSWTIEQGLFDGSFKIPDMRWLVELLYSLSLLVPLGVIVLLVKERRMTGILRTWLLAGLLALCLVPARLASMVDAQAIAALQIAGMLVFMLGLGLWSRLRADPHRPEVKPGWQGLSIGLVITLALAFPWLLWGALGSPIDILLDLAVALLTGTAAMLILQAGLYSGEDAVAPATPLSRTLADGLIALVLLVILVTGIGQSGNQWLLSLSIPVLGWAVVLLRKAVVEAGKNNWPALAVFLGLCIAWPLLYVDADELQLVITSGAGELMEWASREAFLMLFLGVVLTILLFIVYRRMHNLESPARVLSAGLLVVAALVYFLVGRPGFYGERIFVILRDQADVSSAVKISDYNQRRAYVYHTLVTTAEKDQAGLRQSLSRLGIAYTPYYLVNAIEVQGGPLVRLWMMTRPEVDRVLDNPVLRPLPAPIPVAQSDIKTSPAQPQWNLTMIEADRVWKELGVTGQGVVIGQSDTGVQGDHPELAAQYHGKGGHNDYNWLDPWNGSTQPVDIAGHGTHTLGSILGKTVGVAPGATWIGCVNLARNLGNPSVYLNCMQFMLAPFPEKGDPFKDGAPSRGAEVLNNSWGCPWVEGCDPNSLLPAVKVLRDAGIFVVVSAGNSGYSGCGSVEDPLAIYEQAYSVGAVDQNGNLSTFSSRGPVTIDGSRRLKPDIAAPGEGVLSSWPGGSYYVASGTSMAGPHVVGVVALMWSANPRLVGNIDQTVKILDQSTRSYQGSLDACVGKGVPNDGVGYGIVDAYNAVKLALEAR
jgi:subtilisin family serine protease